MKNFHDYIDEHIDIKKIYYNKLNNYCLYTNDEKNKLFCKNQKIIYEIIREDNIFKMKKTQDIKLEKIDEDISIYITINYIIIIKFDKIEEYNKNMYKYKLKHYYIFYYINNNIISLKYLFKINTFKIQHKTLNTNLNCITYSILFNNNLYEKILNNVDDNVNIIILNIESYETLLNNNIIYQDNGSEDNSSFNEDNSSFNEDNSSFNEDKVKDLINKFNK